MLKGGVNYKPINGDKVYSEAGELTLTGIKSR